MWQPPAAVRQSVSLLRECRKFCATFGCRSIDFFSLCQRKKQQTALILTFRNQNCDGKLTLNGDLPANAVDYQFLVLSIWLDNKIIGSGKTEIYLWEGKYILDM